MIGRLQSYADAIGARRRRRRIERIVAQLEARVPAIRVEASESAVAISGRALVRRWLSDPALRFAGTMSK